MRSADTVVAPSGNKAASRRASLRMMLGRIISNTEYELDALRGGIREHSGERRAVGDAVDDITREADLSTIAARANALTQKLTAAADALRRLNANNGSYGVCEDCAEAISETRLFALPFATRCIACQEGAERVGPLTRRQVGARYTT